jgi:hypothetical protein
MRKIRILCGCLNLLSVAVAEYRIVCKLWRRKVYLGLQFYRLGSPRVGCQHLLIFWWGSCTASEHGGKKSRMASKCNQKRQRARGSLTFQQPSSGDGPTLARKALIP